MTDAKPAFRRLPDGSYQADWRCLSCGYPQSVRLNGDGTIAMFTAPQRDERFALPRRPGSAEHEPAERELAERELAERELAEPERERTLADDLLGERDA